MPYMLWEQRYSVNIKEIDAQHKKMFNLINELESALCAGQNRQIMEKIFMQMADYVVLHFSTEENYFEKFAYDATQEHISEHRMFERQLAEFKKNLAQNSDLNIYIRYLSAEVMKFLRKWWIAHICSTDKKYVSCLHDHGVI